MASIENQDAPPEDTASHPQPNLHSPFRLSEKAPASALTKLKHKGSFRPGAPRSPAILEEPDSDTLEGKDPSELGRDFVNTYHNRLSIICRDASKDVGVVPNTPAQVQKMLKQVVALSMQGLTQHEKDVILREHMGEYIESMKTQTEQRIKYGEARAQKEYLDYI